MIGLIELTGKIIATVDTKLSEKIVQEKDLVNEIFKEFLFASVFQANTSNEPSKKVVMKMQKGTRKDKKSSTSANESRAAAYKLLNELIKKSPVLLGKFFKELMLPLLDVIKKPNKWNFMPSGQFSSTQRYVGLKNLGCICYMNSMMQ